MNTLELLTEDQERAIGAAYLEQPNDNLFDFSCAVKHCITPERNAAQERTERFGCCGDASRRSTQEVISRTFDDKTSTIFQREVFVKCPWGWTCPKGQISPFILLFGVLNACRNK